MSNSRHLMLLGATVGSYLYYKNNLPTFDANSSNVHLIKYQNPSKFAGFVSTNVFCQTSIENTKSNELSLEENTVDTQEVTQKPKKSGFKDSKFIEYENRIRAYSTPDKIFRYFATYKFVYDNGDSEIFMTPEDFLRSITPGEKQPDKLGLDKFKIKKITDKNGEKTTDVINEKFKSSLPEKNLFSAIGKCGFINFSDYLFLLTVLSTPQRNFEIAFRMFDLNGDGEVDIDEFQQVTNTARSQTSFGHRHRDHKTTGNVVKSFKDLNSGITAYFFGPTGKEKKLTVQRFIQFQQQLQNDILRLEFNKFDPENTGLIREVDFARILLTYSGLNLKRQKAILKRVRKKYNSEDGESSNGVSFTETRDFFLFLKDIHDVDVAFDFYHIVGADIDKDTMKQVAKTVSGLKLSDKTVDVVFTAFDEDGNGTLSNKEFVVVMKKRLMRGLEKPKDTGLFRLLNAALHCALETTWKG